MKTATIRQGKNNWYIARVYDTKYNDHPNGWYCSISGESKENLVNILINEDKVSLNNIKLI